MIEHPWTELQILIKEKWLTQKAFSLILWKKVSEVNELLKWKRNITIQRDYLLHQTLWTPIKYWILKQVDYDYSLIDIDEDINNNSGSTSITDQDWNKEQNENKIEPGLNWVENTQDSSSQAPQNDNNSVSSWAKAKDLRWETSELNTQDSSSLYSSEWQDKDDEDFKKRAKIFKSF